MRRIDNNFNDNSICAIIPYCRLLIYNKVIRRLSDNALFPKSYTNENKASEVKKSLNEMPL